MLFRSRETPVDPWRNRRQRPHGEYLAVGSCASEKREAIRVDDLSEEQAWDHRPPAGLSPIRDDDRFLDAQPEIKGSLDPCKLPFIQPLRKKNCLLGGAGPADIRSKASNASAGLKNGPFNRFDFAEDVWPRPEPIQGLTIFQEEHKGLREILAGVGGCVVGDEFVEQVSVEESQLSLRGTASFFARQVFRVAFEGFPPLVVGERIAIRVIGSECPREPFPSKKGWVLEIPSVGVFMPDRIAQGQPRFAGLVREIARQIDNAWAVAPLGIMADLFKNVSPFPDTFLAGDYE